MTWVSIWKHPQHSKCLIHLPFNSVSCNLDCCNIPNLVALAISAQKWGYLLALWDRSECVKLSPPFATCPCCLESQCSRYTSIQVIELSSLTVDPCPREKAGWDMASLNSHALSCSLMELCSCEGQPEIHYWFFFGGGFESSFYSTWLFLIDARSTPYVFTDALSLVFLIHFSSLELVLVFGLVSHCPSYSLLPDCALYLSG